MLACQHTLLILQMYLLACHNFQKRDKDKDKDKEEKKEKREKDKKEDKRKEDKVWCTWSWVWATECVLVHFSLSRKCMNQQYPCPNSPPPSCLGVLCP